MNIMSFHSACIVSPRFHSALTRFALGCFLSGDFQFARSAGRQAGGTCVKKKERVRSEGKREEDATDRLSF
jgi:hypothetical protein